MRIEIQDCNNTVVSIEAEVGPSIVDALQYIIIPALLALGYQHDTISEHIRPEGFDD